MNQVPKYIFYFIVSLCTSLSNTSLGMPTTPTSPEQYILDASQMLNSLQGQLDAIKTVRSSKGAHINVKQAESFLEKADLFFDQQIPFAALYWYSKYLNLIQIPPSAKFLHVQKNLFYIYSQTHQHQKSFEAAKKYTTTFVTIADKNYSDLEALLRKFHEDLSFSNINKNELKSFISGFSSINFPEHVRYRMLYLIAKIADRSGLYSIASQWLANAGKYSADKEVIARTKLFQAILAIRLKKFERANHILSATLQEIDPNDQLLPFYHLFLGRLNFVLNRPSIAEESYLSITEGSAAYSPGIFEQIFLYASLNQWDKAKTSAALYLGFNTQDSRTKVVRRIMPFLDMQAGHFDQANEHLRANINVIENLEQELRSFGNSNSYKAYLSFKQIESTINQLIDMPVLSIRLKKLDGDLSYLAAQSNSLEGNLKHSLHSISKANITSYNPDLHHYYLQLLTLGSDLLKVGHMLTSAEKNIYENLLSRSEQVQQTALWNRRKNLMLEKYQFRREANPMRAESNYLEINEAVASVWSRMQKINAMLTANRHMLSLEENENCKAIEHSSNYLERVSSQLNDQVSDLLKNIREKRFKHQATVFVNLPQKIFFSDYLALLNEESEIYKPYRGKFNTASNRIQAEKLTHAWGFWQKIADQLNKSLAHVESKISDNVNGAIASINDLKTQLESQNRHIIQSENQFKTIASNSLGFITDYYTYQLSQLKAKYQKWTADLKWNQYKIIKASELEANENFKAESTRFKNSLFDIKNGTLESWQQ